VILVELDSVAIRWVRQRTLPGAKCKGKRRQCFRTNFPFRRAAVEVPVSWILSASHTVSVYIQGHSFLVNIVCDFLPLIQLALSRDPRAVQFALAF
jgi:hypothetical protein